MELTVAGQIKKRKSQPASMLHGKVHTALLPRKPADNLTKPAFSVMNLHQMSFLGFGVGADAEVECIVDLIR